MLFKKCCKSISHFQWLWRLIRNWTLKIRLDLLWAPQMLALLAVLISSPDGPMGFWVMQNGTSKKWLVYFIITLCARDAIYQNNRAGVWKQITNELFGGMVPESWAFWIHLRKFLVWALPPRAGSLGKPRKSWGESQPTTKQECWALKLNESWLYRTVFESHFWYKPLYSSWLPRVSMWL